MVARWDGVGDGVVVGDPVVYGSNVAFPKEYNEKLKQTTALLPPSFVSQCGQE